MKYFNVLTCLVLLWIEYSILLDVVVDVLWDSKNYKLKKLLRLRLYRIIRRIYIHEYEKMYDKKCMHMGCSDVFICVWLSPNV